MRPASGSTAWLMAHELRLTWRGAVERGPRSVVVGAILFVLMSLAGLVLGLALRDLHVPIAPATILWADLALMVVFSLMLSQTLGAAAETLYARGDLDLLLSSPIAPYRVMAVRLSAVAANVFIAFALLISPLLLPVALIGHPPWLAVYGVLLAIALSASAAGVMLAMGLFRLIGPRRTREAAQILATLIGAAFFLATQVKTILGGRQFNLWISVSRQADLAERFARRPGAAWPLRALLGEPGPLILILAIASLLFIATVIALGRRFDIGAAMADGAAPAKTKTTGRAPRFPKGPFPAILRKELRLLGRDIGLLSQVLLRLIYLAPLTFILLRNAGQHARWALPTGVGLVCFTVGQLAENLSWITLSAEDSPDLIASAPVTAAAIRKAKLCAVFLPLSVLMAIPLGVLTVLSLPAGLAAIAGAATSALASALINDWHHKPAKRSEFRRRSATAWTINIAQLAVGALIAWAAALLAALSPYALAPLATAGLAMILLRRDPKGA